MRRLLIVLALAGCAPAAPPPLDPVEIQRRAMIAQEDAANAARARLIQAQLNYWLSGGPGVGTTRGW